MRSFFLSFIIIFFSACGLVSRPVDHTPVQLQPDIWQEQEINLISGSMHGCYQAFNEAINYLHMNGVGIRYNKDAESSLVCIPDDPVLVKVLSVARAEGGALLNGKLAYIKVTGNADYDAKLMLHELCHMFWGCEHTGSGVMSFSEDMRALSSGYSESTWAYIKDQSRIPSSTAFASYRPKGFKSPA